MRRLLPFIMATTLACGGGGGGSPSENRCASIAGNYSGSFSNTCQNTFQAPMVVAQSGCNFSAVIPGSGDSITGTVTSGSSATFTIRFGAPCSGGANGAATISGSGLVGTWSGHAVGCCDPISGSFTLTR